MQVAAGVAGWDDCALNIYSTVVSRAGPDRGILDAGSKTLTSDTGGLEGHGLILEHPEAKIARFAEEHGFLDLARSNTRPNVGDVVRIVPNHVCVVVNMMDEVVMVRGDEIIGTLPVAAPERRARAQATSPSPTRRNAGRERGLQQIAAGRPSRAFRPAANTPDKRRIMKSMSSSSKAIPPAVEIARAIGAVPVS
jgi:hypothetical protein